MLITARAAVGPADQRGVIGHARSHDLRHWTAQPPLSMPGAGFGQLEVMQVVTVQGRPLLLFSCLHDALSRQRQAARMRGGIWSAPAASFLGPFDVAAATRLADESLYSGRLIQNRSGQPALLAFRNMGADGRFTGEITDPMPVTWSATDRLTLTSPRWT
jgi:beta-fructofuranosidase